MAELKKYVIIVAGGSGNRMKAEIPKQFIKIGTLPILMHTINHWYTYSSEIHIIITLPSKDTEYWRNLCNQYNFIVPHKVVPGGQTRYDSVKNGLYELRNEDGLVAIHDGVRPFITNEIIEKSFQIAEEKGNAVTCVALKDSIRIIDGENSKTLNRDLCRLIQTPQTFKLDILKKAYNLSKDNTFSDDASVVESLGIHINLMEGSYDNIKITTPEDLLLAEAVLKKFRSQTIV